MNETKTRLTVVDNQLADFNYISAKLSEGAFDVYPKKDKYPDFIDAVRTALSKRYTSERVSSALDFIYQSVDQHNSDGFVIDFQLVGCHDAKTGIYLASLFQVRYNVPIFYLSRTPSSSKRVKDMENTVPGAIWLEKGYAGISVSEDDYFNRHILKRIRQELTIKQEASYQEKLSFLREKKFLQRYDSFIEKLAADYGGNSQQKETAKKCIDAFFEAANGSAAHSDIKQIVQQYKQ